MREPLTCYAVTEKLSRGRTQPQPIHLYRSNFERDRDRIIHSQAFRRLEGKTQVFTLASDGCGDDNYRNRLTHSIEVAQIGRTIAKNLGLNQNLTEAICLAHDLGHSPFGHTGEIVLDSLMAEFGGFEHNRQTLRIVDLLEHPYPDFVGLNLMYETRLGLAKHRSPFDNPGTADFIEANCSLEGQVADIADRIAYNCHDLEDGLRAGLLTNKQLEMVQIFTEVQAGINAAAIKDKNIRDIRTAKAIIDKLVSDCIDASRKAIADAKIKTLDNIYSYEKNLVGFSPKSLAVLVELEKFLLHNLYHHKSIIRTSEKIKDWLQRLFEKLCQNPELMPDYFQRLISNEGLQQAVTDYIAGMTDRFCLKMLNTMV